ncbi:MAG TPA: 3-deoxy-7-phosphoheptulonate synthase class II [Allosphingosinicella sp.]|jgi:3-deoxy-7-phosphoheptulonate synthase
MTANWTPASWRGHEARQQPAYPDGAALDAALRELAAYPALVGAAEARRLTADIAEAQAGRAFLLQGGDCAESFAEFSTGNIGALHALLSGMADRLAAASGLRVVKAGRIAGQFAKPRSRDLEDRCGESLPVYRGDIVNGIAFEEGARRPDPKRMFRAYAQSAATLSHLRELSAAEPFYTCHEALLLPYEEALVRRDGASWYGSSAAFLWVGDRTRFEGSAHVEFLRGLSNPLGIKCGPELDADLLLSLLDRLNPARQAGRITLISRMGAGRIAERLPPLIRAVECEGHKVLWSCDPMHGNTVKANGFKTRPLERILEELAAFFALCRAEGVCPGGVHVELTGRDVAECTGGAEPVREADLGDRYHTHCDPRLNPAQAMEVAALVARELARNANARAA